MRRADVCLAGISTSFLPSSSFSYSIVDFNSILGLSLSQYLPTAVFAVPVQEGVELHEQDPLPFCAPSLGDREEQVHLRVLQGEQEAPPSICKGRED